MSCTNCGKNRDESLPYSIRYIINNRISLRKLREIWDTVCGRCCLNLGYAEEVTEEEHKLECN